MRKLPSALSTFEYYHVLITEREKKKKKGTKQTTQTLKIFYCR